MPKKTFEIAKDRKDQETEAIRIRNEYLEKIPKEKRDECFWSGTSKRLSPDGVKIFEQYFTCYKIPIKPVKLRAAHILALTRHLKGPYFISSSCKEIILFDEKDSFLFAFIRDLDKFAENKL